MSIKRDIVFRVGLIYMVLFVMAVFIAAKLVTLQFITDDKWKKKAENTRIKTMEIPPHRGDVYAEDMRLLASSVPYYEVRMDMKAPSLTEKIFYGEIDSLSLCLSRLFGDKSKAAYKAELISARKKGRRYYLVKRRVNYLELKELKTFPIFRKGRYKGGVIYVQTNRRRMPHNNLASRTIGRTAGPSGARVKVGLEGAYDNYLAGVEGVQRMQKIAGNIWMPLDDAKEIEPEDGSSIVTTLNVDLQDVAEKALLRELTKHQAHHGTAVVMEVNSGEVKAIVNLTRVRNQYQEVYNYAVGESAEPGSTFKLPALMAAMEDGVVDLGDTINTGKGKFEYYDVTIHDDSYSRGGYGKITVQEVFEKSSNVGMAQIITSSYKGKPHRFVDRLYGMNLNESLGLAIKGEGTPLIKYPGDKTWDGFTLASMSYGYSLRLTPLQTLTFYNAVANGGEMVRPRFVKEIRKHGDLEKTFVKEVINPMICSRATLKKAQKMLEGVVERGTATNLKNLHFKIAGKTGTNRIYNADLGYKIDGRVSYQASFVGYFPAEAPKYSCIVVVNAPTQNVIYGNLIAGPVFKEIANKIYSSNIQMTSAINAKKPENIEIPFSKNGYAPEIIAALKELDIKTSCSNNTPGWVETNKTENEIELTPKEFRDNLMPNVCAMGLKDALFILENMGLKVSVDGRGSVRQQSVLPGARVRKGDKISLKMSFTDS